MCGPKFCSMRISQDVREAFRATSEEFLELGASVYVDRPANNEAETSVGLGAPIYVYALIESALRGAAGTDEAEHRAAGRPAGTQVDTTARDGSQGAGTPRPADPPTSDASRRLDVSM
jgi:hypothetical protein